MADGIVKTISSRQNPVVKRFREAASGEARNLILLDGAHLIEEAVRGRLAVHSVACSPHALADPGIRALLAELEDGQAEMLSVTPEVLSAMSPVQSPSGIVALAARPTIPLDTALAAAPQLVVVAVDVQDPGNVGAIIRAAEAGGATAAIFAGASADPFGWKALRGAMGSSLRLPTVVAAAQEVMTRAHARNIRVIATSPHGTRSLFDVDLRGPVALLLGAEGGGLPAPLIAAADDTIRIPMRPPVESLNVAVAAALLVYEASRQRAHI